jgi:hypothetical protein
VGDCSIRAVKKTGSIYVQRAAADANFAAGQVCGSAGGSGQPYRAQSYNLSG